MNLDLKRLGIGRHFDTPNSSFPVASLDAQYMNRESQNTHNNLLFSSIIHGSSRVYFSKVTIDVDRLWPILFEQFE